MLFIVSDVPKCVTDSQYITQIEMHIMPHGCENGCAAMTQVYFSIPRADLRDRS